MRIVLFAHENSGVKALQELKRNERDIVRTYTHPPNMDTHEKIWYESVTKECKKYNVPVVEKISLTEQDEKEIQHLAPDIILSIGWRRLIPKTIFQIPRFGSVNIHGGLLPKYRGFSPINWAIINGETEIGITAHYIVEDVDAGDIILQRKLSVNVDETAYDVYKKILSQVPDVVTNTLSLIEKHRVKPKKQNHTKGFICTRRFPDDGKIDWSQDRTKVYNLVRALSDPFPNAYCFYNEKKIYIKKAKLTNEDFRGMQGRICSIRDDGVIVTCGNDHTKNQSVLITEIAIEDKIFKPRDYFKKLWLQLT